jgi:peptidyl-prolyl cis-trans isomerase D
MARETPAFHGPDGRFSKSVFDTVLRNNGLTEGRFLEMLRGEAAQRQLLSAISAGVAAPDSLVAPIYVGEYQKRSVRMAEFALAAAPEPPAPEDAVLTRWYDNHPDSYRSPEYRRIKAIVLTPERLSQDVTVAEQEVRDAWDATRARYITPALRTAEVIAVADAAKAATLARTWRDGADWDAMQAAATAEGATAVRMEDATETQFPDPDLSKAVFTAPLDAPTEPVKGALGWYVVKVTAATAGTNPRFEDVAEQVKARVVADKAADLVYDRANKVDGLLGNGTALDDMPDNLGLVGLAGTLDSEGLTPEDAPAPIPGSPELRKALIAAAFQTQRGDPPRLLEAQGAAGAGSSYYALVVEDVTPAALKPFDAVREQVLDDWKADQQRRAQEEAAARMLAALKSGQSFEDAATIANVIERTTPVTTRGETPEGVPAELVRAMFTMKPDEPTMVETPEAFIVAILAEVIDPDMKADPTGYNQVRLAVARTIGADIGTAFTDAVRLRANPRINQKTLDQIVQP